MKKKSDQKGNVTIATLDQWAGDQKHISLGFVRDSKFDVSVCIHDDDLFIEVWNVDGSNYGGYAVPLQKIKDLDDS